MHMLRPEPVLGLATGQLAREGCKLRLRGAKATCVGDSLRLALGIIDKQATRRPGTAGPDQFPRAALGSARK